MTSAIFGLSADTIKGYGVAGKADGTSSLNSDAKNDRASGYRARSIVDHDLCLSNGDFRTIQGAVRSVDSSATPSCRRAEGALLCHKPYP